jgi:hypothetical protein
MYMRTLATVARIRRNGEPDRRYGHKGPQPHLWDTGPDPWIRRLRYKFLRARAQARFWHQLWQLTWEEYVTLMRKQVNHGRDLAQINLCRKDADGTWSLANCELRTRYQMVRRQKHVRQDGTRRRRVNTKQQKQK